MTQKLLPLRLELSRPFLFIQAAVIDYGGKIYNMRVQKVTFFSLFLLYMQLQSNLLKWKFFPTLSDCVASACHRESLDRGVNWSLPSPLSLSLSISSRDCERNTFKKKKVFFVVVVLLLLVQWNLDILHDKPGHCNDESQFHNVCLTYQGASVQEKYLDITASLVSSKVYHYIKTLLIKDTSSTHILI